MSDDTFVGAMSDDTFVGIVTVLVLLVVGAFLILPMLDTPCYIEHDGQYLKGVVKTDENILKCQIFVGTNNGKDGSQFLYFKDYFLESDKKYVKNEVNNTTVKKELDVSYICVANTSSNSQDKYCCITGLGCGDISIVPSK